MCKVVKVLKIIKWDRFLFVPIPIIKVVEKYIAKELVKDEDTYLNKLINNG